MMITAILIISLAGAVGSAIFCWKYIKPWYLAAQLQGGAPATNGRVQLHRGVWPAPFLLGCSAQPSSCIGSSRCLTQARQQAGNQRQRTRPQRSRQHVRQWRRPQRSRKHRRHETSVTSLTLAVIPDVSGGIGAAWAGVPERVARTKPAVDIANAVRNMMCSLPILWGHPSPRRKRELNFIKTGGTMH